MAHVLIMPKQGNTVESCIIVEWKVKEGDSLSVDTPVCEVETDKATVEVPADAGGTVLKILCQEETMFLFSSQLWLLENQEKTGKQQ